jgi:superfamily I DNA and RNA helicase
MSVQSMLQHRNLQIHSQNPTDHLIFPPAFPKKLQNRLMELMGSYGFRTFLKDVILHKQAFQLKDLTRYCSPETGKRYLGELLDLNLIEKQSNEGYSLVNAETVFSLGDTLEWYIAQLLQEKLHCDSLWNVTLKDLKSGGDFDVLSECENNLLYLEVKSGPPKGIELENVEAFLQRVNDLAPNITIFFEDTTLRMKDKIVPHFEEILQKKFKIQIHNESYFKRVKNEIFRYGDLFIANSKPGILENIRFCLASYLHDQGLHFGI